MIRENKRCWDGFTLIEMAIVLVVLGMILMVAFYAIPRLTERARLETTKATMDEVAKALTSFAAVNSRLPCPDVNGDGLEGTAGTCAAGDVVGRVPYRTLGLADPVLDEAHLPVRYAVYRNSNSTASDDADLAALLNRFKPVLPGSPPTLTTYTGLPDNPAVVLPTEGINKTRYQTNVENDLDFCLALRNAKKATADTNFVNTLDLSGKTPSFNSAFVLASGGVEDADGSGGDIAFDGVNVGPGVSYESPARRRGVGYDDIVYAMPFDQLESRLSCAAITVSVSSAANVAIADAHTLVQTEDAVWSAKLAVDQANIAVATAAFSVVVSAITVWVAANDLDVAIACDVAGICPGAATTASAGVAVGLAATAAALAVASTVVAALTVSSANTAYTSAKGSIPGAYAQALKAFQDAVDANTRGGQL